jgi:hypothetical protein
MVLLISCNFNRIILQALSNILRHLYHQPKYQKDTSKRELEALHFLTSIHRLLLLYNPSATSSGFITNRLFFILKFTLRYPPTLPI